MDPYFEFAIGKLTPEMITAWLTAAAVAGMVCFPLCRSGRIKTVTGAALSFFVFYLFFVLTVTVAERMPEENSKYELELFWSYKAVFSGASGLASEIFWNIVLFVPVGFLVSFLLPGKKVYGPVLAGVIFSSGIEIIQLLTHRGLFEFDDIFSNTIGALAGYFIYRLSWLMKRKSVQAAVCLFFCVAAYGMVSVHTDSKAVDNSSGDFCFQLEDVSVSDGRLVLSGFGFQYQTAAPDRKFGIKLKSTQTGKRKKLNVTYGIERKDVQNYFACEYDYSRSGFTAAVDVSEINPEEEYEVLINWGTIFSVPSGVYISGTDIHYVPEEEFIPPDVRGTDLEQITENGYLRVFRPDFSCYVYQYGNSLYWFADEGFHFEENGATYIQYQLWTTQTERLPQQRLENEWYWDNIGDYFENHEITDEINCGKYRVYRRDLPTEYSITSIVTGFYKNGEWIWQNYFRPYYMFGQNLSFAGCR